eukprot:431027-Prymnesium_polylepis.1
MAAAQTEPAAAGSADRTALERLAFCPWFCRLLRCSAVATSCAGSTCCSTARKQRLGGTSSKAEAQQHQQHA